MKIFRLYLFLPILLFTSCVSYLNKSLPPLTENEMKVLKLMGGKLLSDGNIAIGSVKILRATNEISFPAKVQIRQGDLEVLISTPIGRTHEALLVTSIEPYNLQLALFLIGAHNGTMYSTKIEDIDKKSNLTQGSLVELFIVVGDQKRIPIEDWLFNKRTNRSKSVDGWVFVGSNFGVGKKCLATEEGNVVNIWNYGNSILANPGSSGENDDYFASFTTKMPPSDTSVNVLIKIK